MGKALGGGAHLWTIPILVAAIVVAIAGEACDDTRLVLIPESEPQPLVTLVAAG